MAAVGGSFLLGSTAFSGEFPADVAGVATADAAQEDAGVVFGGVAIT